MTNSNVIDTKRKSIYEMCQKELNICFCKLLMCIVWILVQFCFLLIFSFWNTHDRQSNFMLCLFWNTWFLKINSSFWFDMVSQSSRISEPLISRIKSIRYKPFQVKSKNLGLVTPWTFWCHDVEKIPIAQFLFEFNLSQVHLVRMIFSGL